VNERRARELVACERTRVESALAKLGGEIRDEGSLGRQQTGEYEIRQLSRGRICLRRPRGRPPRTARRRRARRGAHRTRHVRQIGRDRDTDPGRAARGATPCRADRRGAATLRAARVQLARWAARSTASSRICDLARHNDPTCVNGGFKSSRHDYTHTTRSSCRTDAGRTTTQRMKSEARLLSCLPSGEADERAPNGKPRAYTHPSA